MDQDNSVPDLYELAFMPGQFRCPRCDFRWSIQTLSVVTGRIGTTEEDRQTPDCLNDGTRMVMVTYREQLEEYALRLKEELDHRDHREQFMHMLADFAVGNGDVCELIARRIRACLQRECNCGADRTGPSAEAHAEWCEQAEKAAQPEKA